MHARIAPSLLAIAGLIHLLPLPGLLGAAWLQRLYGIEVDDAGLLLLLRHRALLFGLLGSVLLIAAWQPRWRLAALLIGLLSCGGFLLLAGDPRALEPALRRVWLADLLALACLLGEDLAGPGEILISRAASERLQAQTDPPPTDLQLTPLQLTISGMSIDAVAVSLRVRGDP